MSAPCPDANTAQALQLIIGLLPKRNPLQHKPSDHTFTQEGVSRVAPQMKSIDHVHVSVADRAAAERWYDAVLGLTRVEVWNSTKTAARLLNADAGRNPILVRLDYDGGHGVGSTKKQQQEERADVFSFFLWRMGVAGFELVP